MNGVSGFGEGFVGGCAVVAGNAVWERMQVMYKGIRNESRRGLEMIVSILEVAGRGGGEGCVSDLVRVCGYKSRERERERL